MTFDMIDYNSFWNNHCFTFFPYKSIRDQIWHSRKLGQGKPRVIIWINAFWLGRNAFRSPIQRRLHMKFGFNWPCGFRGEDVWKCWHKYTHIHVIRTTEAYIYYKSPMRLPLRWAKIILTYRSSQMQICVSCFRYFRKTVHSIISIISQW